jgi:hypothetical protein
MYLKYVYLCSTAWIEVMDLFAKCFVGDLTSLVRANSKITLEIITNPADVFVLTFICLRRSYISYNLGSRTVRSWRRNSVRCFSQCWPWNALRNRTCGRVLLLCISFYAYSLYFIYVWHAYLSPKTYKWFGTFIIKDGRYTFTFSWFPCVYK